MKKNKYRKYICIIVLVVSGSILSGCAEPGRPTVSGRVSDASDGTLLNDVTISCSSKTDTSHDGGMYYMTLTPGAHTLTATFDQYKDYKITFELGDTEDKSLMIALCPDKDGDSYSAAGGSCGTEIDCDDNDPNIYPGSLPVRVLDIPYKYHVSLQTAYDSHPTSTPAAMQSRDVVIAENVDMNKPMAVTLESGRGCDYETSVGTTGIYGDMSVSEGRITIAEGKLEIKDTQ